jgi:hypothetical protein
MAMFRYRVSYPKGIAGGFRDQDFAMRFAKMISAEDGCLVSVLDFPHGKGDAEKWVTMASFFQGRTIGAEDVVTTTTT